MAGGYSSSSSKTSRGVNLRLFQPRLVLALLVLAAATLSWLAISHSSLLLTSNADLLKEEDKAIQPKKQRAKSSKLPPTPNPYHNWDLFTLDFQEMLNNLKIFVYPHVSNSSSPFASIFFPHPDPFNPKLGNYFSEHMFKISLLRSSFLTSHPEEAHFFFMPFSINALRNDPRVHSEESIAEFVARYTTHIAREFGFWNASWGSDHFYVCCHSVGRDAASKHRHLQSNAIQVWPRVPEIPLNPPHSRFISSYDLWHGWKEICYSEERRQKAMLKWEPPHVGFIKLNFDSSSLGNPGPSGIGGVLRNENGEVVWAFAGPIGVADALEAEVRAVHQGMILLGQEILGNLVVEGDLLNVIRWLKGTSSHPWRFDHYFDEIKDCIGDAAVIFRHVRRLANDIANWLAREGVSKDALALLGDLPP
ncbi:uncharacterized protein LOC143858674 isoform X3 [Tasmannia lanceolata]|uniref:uncharacterized protein LOC143858674 isoform X3 n=1 Tax=Tasmannia lanceolata TaxID=3420 RepID=UPI00406449B8